MAVLYSIPYLPESVPFSVQIIGIVLVSALAYFLYTFFTSNRPIPGLPIIALSEQGLGPKQSWYKQGKKTIAAGIQKYNAPFQVLTGTGPKIVLPNRFADELKSAPGVSFSEAFSTDFFPNYSGFEPFLEGLHDEGFLSEVVRTKLTQSLGLITDDLVEETTAAVHDIFGEDPEWHEIPLKDGVLHLVARLSSRVFLGKELCRNERWLEIAKGYTINAFITARILRPLPALARPFVHMFNPFSIKLRAMYRDANTLITPEVELRKARAQEAISAGKKPPKTADAIGWMYELAREKRQSKNYVAQQLSLSLAAIHTTSEALTQVMLDLCENPEIVQPLREEIVAVIGAEGWSKTALYKFRLMDSFLKESQRMHPPSFVSMNRYMTIPLTLSDGTILPAGSRVMVAGRYTDSSIYQTPEKFDAFRFKRERDNPEHANSWQHVTVSPQHMAFGYGSHACPGRFFVSNELKIALAHLLVKYDWQAVGSVEAARWEFEVSSMTLPGTRIQLRRRKEVEVDLDLEKMG